MGRWEPDAARRLREAAMELYLARGYEQTTVAEIAAHAGLTARTFFRYFADKREVLFDGSNMLQEHMVDGLLSAPKSASPMEAIGYALEGAVQMLGDRHSYARRRNAVISSHAELRERELIKMADLADALAVALRKRGVKEPSASFAAEAGVAVFRIGFQRWVGDKKDRGLSETLRQSLNDLQAVTSA